MPVATHYYKEYNEESPYLEIPELGYHLPLLDKYEAWTLKGVKLSHVICWHIFQASTISTIVLECIKQGQASAISTSNLAGHSWKKKFL